MTSTSVLRTTVREARPEEAGAVAALVRDGYTAYADELPPDLLRTWVDDVADPGGGVTFVAVETGRSLGPPACTSRARTRFRCRAAPRASAP